MEEVTLYDNPSRFGAGTCWSPNVWKTRLLLNFKGINYKTEWLHGAEIEPTLSSFGIPPHEPGTQLANYTVPAVRLPNGTYIMESLLIAQAIEAMYPEPKAHLDAPILAEVMDTLRWTLRHLVPVLVPRMPRECLSGPSITYHIEARKKTFGMTLEELEEKMGGEAAWKRAMPGLAKLAGILNLSSLVV
ncbi:glutathione s-transferase protein [Pochonia chlamydosporia 170]|uniref:Glutathione s-transferase protein n=1 Tax=Pochonia chlamydosporia 170 TaxID=1380566 RepID=A0A179F2C5_METCM|nr:glutathione s-transferase protein [Pochonia chlamydosporia 170]OAQ59578.2 glutathione s-transferase protein [Pochonia chlamydosporia 170]